MAETGIGKRTIRDVGVRDKTVLVRADLNVPLEDGRIADDARIRASLPTIQYLRERNARVVLCSHLGRPKGKPHPDMSLRVVGERLAQLLGEPVAFAEDCVGSLARTAIDDSANGVVLLENLRFHAGEEANDPAFAEQLAALAQLYVNDAFGAAHRAHASTSAIARFLPAVAGLLLESEVKYLGALVADPPRPFAAIIGGAKVSSKIDAVRHLLPKVDLMLIGGGMANTFLVAQGFSIGKSLLEPDLVETAKQVNAEAARTGKRLLLPVDAVVAPAPAEDAVPAVVAIDSIPDDQLILDIGPRTVSSFVEALRDMKGVVWNGPMGVFEMPAFAKGSYALAHAVADLDATTVVGGGETAQLVGEAGVSQRITHVSTGGGASLEMLEGKPLPGVEALEDMPK